MHTKADVAQGELSSVQLIIERLARNEISEEAAQDELERIWERAYQEPLLRKIILEMFPSLARPKRKAASV